MGDDAQRRIYAGGSSGVVLEAHKPLRQSFCPLDIQQKVFAGAHPDHA